MIRWESSVIGDERLIAPRIPQACKRHMATVGAQHPIYGSSLLA